MHQHRIKPSSLITVVIGLSILWGGGAFSSQILAATMPISSIPLGGVISINDRLFSKINSEGEFMALEPLREPGFADGMNMQDFTTSMCSSAPTPTGTDYFLIGNLMDSRDGKSYEVRKFADGKCWMVDNLKYGGSTATGGTDACASRTAFSGNGSATATNRFGTGTYGDCRNNSSYGYLYSWQAAMQHASAYYNNSFQPTEPTQGICPTGWHIPKGGSTGEFQALHTTVGSPVTGFWQPGGNWKGVYSGHSGATGALWDQGSLGNNWSSTQVSATNVYTSGFGSNIVNVAGSSPKNVGRAVRCIKD